LDIIYVACFDRFSLDSQTKLQTLSNSEAKDASEAFLNVKKVKQSRYRPGVAHRVPGS
jgi:hypothetical protein